MDDEEEKIALKSSLRHQITVCWTWNIGKKQRELDSTEPKQSGCRRDSFHRTTSPGAQHMNNRNYTAVT